MKSFFPQDAAPRTSLFLDLAHEPQAAELAFASALASAAHHGSTAIVANILDSEYGRAATRALIEPALRAAGQADHTAVLELMLDARADWTEHANASLALHSAASGGSICCARILLARGFPLDGLDPHSGRTPLLAAAKRNHIAMAEFLLDRGASPEGRLGDAAAPSPERAFAPTSALHLCCELGYAQLARLLLARGANPNVANEEGYTPLMACVGQLDELLQELLASGANPNATVPGDGGANALHFAVMDGHIDALRVLLSSGADWRAPYGPARISPLALALNESDDECSAMLIASGADPLELMDLGNGDGARPIEDLAAERSMSLTEGLCRSAREKTILDAMRTPRWPPRERPRASSI